MPRTRLVVGDAGTLAIEVARGVHEPDPYAGSFASTMRLREGERVLDLGCGAGTYALAAARRGARVVATDKDPRAVACTLANARRNGLTLDGRVGSLFEPVQGERFDAIVATLPQLPAPEPIDVPTRYGGRDGLDLLRELALRAPRHLAPKGRLYALVTGWAGPEAVAALLAARGFSARVAARTKRAFQPAEYDGYQPGLFAYLDAHARARGGRPAYARRGSWRYLEVSFLEALR
jgi:methylase of polypeptide subunit release factors